MKSGREELTEDRRGDVYTPDFQPFQTFDAI